LTRNPNQTLGRVGTGKPSQTGEQGAKIGRGENFGATKGWRTIPRFEANRKTRKVARSQHLLEPWKKKLKGAGEAVGYERSIWFKVGWVPPGPVRSQGGGKTKKKQRGVLDKLPKNGENRCLFWEEKLPIKNP